MSSHIPLLTKVKVWKRECGISSTGHCWCCRESVSIQGCVCQRLGLFQNDTYPVCHYGHIIARVLGGSVEPDNLRIICAKCNLGMGTRNLNSYHPMDTDDEPVPVFMLVDGPDDQCEGITRSANRCKNKHSPGSRFCSTHRGQIFAE